MTSPVVILYTQPDCPPCDWTKAWLRSHDIEFLEKDVTQDNDAQRELNALGIHSTPVTVRNKYWVVGYDADKLDKLVSESGAAT